MLNNETHLKFRKIEKVKRIIERERKRTNSYLDRATSFKPYSSSFDIEFKEKIRNKFKRQCFICGLPEELNGRKLSIHHINYSQNCSCGNSECNFIPLCNLCHLRTNSNRKFWEKLLTACYEDPYMMMYFSDI